MFINVLGETIKVRKIGEGNFANAYRQGNKVYLRVETYDYTRDAFLHLKGKHFPQIEKLGEDEEYMWYKMPYYRDVDSWDYRVIEFLETMYAVDGKVYSAVDSRHVYFDFAEQIQKEDKIELSLRQAVSQLFQYVAKLPTIPQFDLGYRNLSYDSNRNIILRDIFCP